MSSTTTQRRKGGAPKSTDGFKLAVPLDSTPLKAEVRRHKCGTGAFDESWLNKDCCGLFCAFLTYCLHLYGVYAVCLILIPPWMSTLDEGGVRTLTFMGHLHRLLFTTVAVLAVYAHFKAMTTDPGAVPPDATPLAEDPSNLEAQNGGETDALKQPKRGKRLCRRCNSFKPKRAHHCSVCRRCIIKMDRTYIIVHGWVFPISFLTLVVALAPPFQITALGLTIVLVSETTSISFSLFFTRAYLVPIPSL